MQTASDLEDRLEYQRDKLADAIRDLATRKGVDAARQEYDKRRQAVRDLTRRLKRKLGETPTRRLTWTPHMDGDAGQDGQTENDRARIFRKGA